MSRTACDRSPATVSSATRRPSRMMATRSATASTSPMMWLDEVAEEALEVVGQDTPAGRRLVEMRDFYTYLLAEMPAVIERWQQGKKPRT
ncbi:hypothetical protein [Acrocarpospora macrocephala]|nr:hypothetical protein [Acrocarpospora macrocephala]